MLVFRRQASLLFTFYFSLLEMSVLQARGGHRWNYRAKSFVEQLEGISSSVLLDRVGQAEERCGKSTQGALKEHPNSLHDSAPPL